MLGSLVLRILPLNFPEAAPAAPVFGSQSKESTFGSQWDPYSIVSHPGVNSWAFISSLGLFPWKSQFILYLNRYPFAAAAKSLQSCPTLCDPIDGSPPGSPVPGILLARTLEWVAISFSNA